jgi:hypothetical protein
VPEALLALISTLEQRRWGDGETGMEMEMWAGDEREREREREREGQASRGNSLEVEQRAGLALL